MLNHALFSDDGAHRYWLHRSMSQPGPQPRLMCLWVMLNPSTADCTVNDPTIKRCMGFTAAWGFDDMEVVNLFALRSTDPKMLLLPKMKPRAIGPENDSHIAGCARRADLVVCAWGAFKFSKERSADVLKLVQNSIPLWCVGIKCVGVTQGNHPKHPLYVPAGTKLEKYPHD